MIWSERRGRAGGRERERKRKRETMTETDRERERGREIIMILREGEKGGIKDRHIFRNRYKQTENLSHKGF